MCLKNILLNQEALKEKIFTVAEEILLMSDQPDGSTDGRSVHRFGPRWNISTIWWIAKKLNKTSLSPEDESYSGNPLTFPVNIGLWPNTKLMACPRLVLISKC